VNQGFVAIFGRLIELTAGLSGVSVMGLARPSTDTDAPGNPAS